MSSPILALFDHIEKTLRNLKSGIQKQSLRETKYMFERLTAFSNCLKESLPKELREETFKNFDRHIHFVGYYIDKKDFEYIKSNFDDIVDHDFPDIRKQIYSFIESGKLRERKVTPLSKDVFIVHGRDHKPLKELKTMLSGFGLNPVVLHEKASGSRTIVEKLEKHSDAQHLFKCIHTYYDERLLAEYLRPR